MLRLFLIVALVALAGPSFARMQPPDPSGPFIFTVANSGSDANDCVSAPCRTVQAAYQEAYQNYDFSMLGQQPQIHIAPGTSIVGTLNISGNMVGSIGIMIVPDGPGITWTAAGACIALADGGIVIMGLPNNGTAANPSPGFPSPGIAFTCNQGPSPQPGDYFLHNYAVLDDFTRGATNTGGGAGVSWVYTDNVAAMIDIEFCTTFSGTYGPLIDMEVGGRATVSGVCAASGNPTAAMIAKLGGPATLITSAQFPDVGRFESLGLSQIGPRACWDKQGVQLPNSGDNDNPGISNGPC